MRILHVDTGLTWRGGQQQVFYLHQGVSRRGVSSHLVCSARGELWSRASIAGLAPLGLPLRGEWDLASAWRIAQEIRARGITHLHLHSSHAQTLGLLASRMTGLPNTVVTRRVDFVPRRHLLNRWKYGAGVARFVAISRAIRDILMAFGVRPDRIRLVPSGVELANPTPGLGGAVRRELGVKEGQPLIGNIAHLADHKGQRYLIEAIPRVLEVRPDVRFVIVGEGELEGDLKARASALGLGDRLLFTGFRTDVRSVMGALDLFVMPSHLEGLGTIVLDAQAAGKPVVATRAGGIPDVLEDGVHGLLVPPRDANALADGILKILEDPALARRLAEAGRRRVEERFSVDAMVEGNLAVYEELGT